jgi:phage terminase large subunit GpA-like protein
MVAYHEGLADLLGSFREWLMPQPFLKPSIWTEENRSLSRATSSRVGPMKLWPWQIQPLNDIVEHPECGSVVLQWPAQSMGKSEVALSLIGWSVAVDPCTWMVVCPDLGLAQEWSRKRFGGMVRETPLLRSLVPTERVRAAQSNGATIYYKSFPGGGANFVGSYSGAGLSSRNVKRLILDDLDKFTDAIESEGDPLTLAELRQESFPDAFTLLVSTPTLAGFSRIANAYEQSNQCKWYVGWPCCNHRSTLTFKDLVWDKREVKGKTVHEPQTARLKCPSCGQEHDDKVRQKMVRGGWWQAEAPAVTQVRGYQISNLCCLLGAHRGFKNRLHELAAKFLKAKAGGATTLQGFINGQLAEVWQPEQTVATHPELIMARAEDYAADPTEASERIMPARSCLLTIGADCQLDRIEAELVAWRGPKGYEESWSLDYRVFKGDTRAPLVWREFEAWMRAEWRHPALSYSLVPVCVCIDYGGPTGNVAAAFVKRHSRERVYAVKGMGGVARHGQPWVTLNKEGLALLASDSPKFDLYGRLNVLENGPGKVHTPKCRPLSWYEGLTAEVIIQKKNAQGFPVRRFFLPQHRRNEPLDARCYAMAALVLLRPEWEKIEKRFPMAAEQEKIAPALQSQEVAQQPAKAPVPPVRRRMRPSIWGSGGISSI